MPRTPCVEQVLEVAVGTVFMNAINSLGALERYVHQASTIKAPGIGLAGDPAEESTAQVTKATTTGGTGSRYLWQPHEAEIMVALVEASLAQGGKLPTNQAIEALGLATVPDPTRKLYNRVRNKLERIRNSIQTGLDPTEARKPRPNRSLKWTSWVVCALKALPQYQGTFAEVCQVLEDDPTISPLLDRSPDPRKLIPYWHSHIATALSHTPGVKNMGKQGGTRCIYRYDPSDPAAAKVKRSRAPTKGLPHLGKHEASKGTLGQERE